MRSSNRRASIASTLSVVNGLILGVFFTLGPLGGEVAAHPEFNPITTNHYLKVDLTSPTAVRLACTVMYGAAPAYAMRKAADTNANGRLEDPEVASIGEKVSSLVKAGLSLELDGQAVRVAPEPAQVGLLGNDVAPSPFSVDVIFRLTFPAGAHKLWLDDKTELPQLGETEIKIEESPAVELTSGFRGRSGTTEKQTKFLYRGPRFSALEDRSITVGFAPRAVVAAPRNLALPLAVLGAVSLAGAAAFLLLRRRRR